MSNNDDQDDRKTAGMPDAPRARFRGTRWPGLIWAVPVAAVIIVMWLGISAFTSRGPEVSVSFPTTGGIKPGSTKVEYRGMAVGHVDTVKLGKALDTMKVTMRMDGDMQGHLGKGTTFWIAGQSVSLGNLSSFKSVISGPHIDVAPKNGKVASHFEGLRHAPVRGHGETITIIAEKPGNLSRGAGIYFRHYRIGHVVSVDMERDGKHFIVTGFIQRKRENLISARSRFWNAGGATVKLGGAGPHVMLQSIPALVSGALGVETPSGGPKIKPETRFHLYASESDAKSAPGPHAVTYQVILAGGTHGLLKGAEVKLEGQKVGVVTSVAMNFDPATNRLATTVDLALEPRNIPLASPGRWNLADPRPQMNAMLGALIGRGLRARRTQATPVIGAQMIALDIVKNPPQAMLGAGTPPEIPSTTASSVKQIMAQVSEILANVHTVTTRIAAVSRSPRTKRTLERIDRTITHVDAITRTTSRQMPQLLANVRRASQAADEAMQSVQGLMQSQGSAANAPESTSLPRALYELTRAARSLRELTNYLSGHPNSVIFGKGR